MTTGHSRGGKNEIVPDADYALNEGVMDWAIENTLSRVIVDTEHDVPYVGSCSTNFLSDLLAGQPTRIYIDWQLPRYLIHMGKRFEIARYLVQHEVTEALYEFVLNAPYLVGHQKALWDEYGAVVSDRCPWPAYDNFFKLWIPRIAARPSYPNCPPDIYLRPEQDCRDTRTIRKMLNLHDVADVSAPQAGDWKNYPQSADDPTKGL